jgi:hypothetical protein
MQVNSRKANHRQSTIGTRLIMSVFAALGGMSMGMMCDSADIQSLLEGLNIKTFKLTGRVIPTPTQTATTTATT